MIVQFRTLPRIKPLMMSALPVNNEVAGMLLAKITPPGRRVFTSNVNQVILGLQSNTFESLDYNNNQYV